MKPIPPGFPDDVVPPQQSICHLAGSRKESIKASRLILCVKE